MLWLTTNSCTLHCIGIFYDTITEVSYLIIACDMILPLKQESAVKSQDGIILEACGLFVMRAAA